MSQHQKELDRHFAWFEKKLPPRPAKFVSWVRKPSSIYARDSARHTAGRRRLSQLPAGARTLDAAARTPFVRAGRAAAAEADGAGARMGRAQMARAPARKARTRARKKRAMSASRHLQGIQPISVFGCDRNHTCDSKTSLVGNYVASSRHSINFSFANQPADSFSASGVNWRPSYERHSFRFA